MAHIKFDADKGILEMDTALQIADTEAIYKWGARIVFEERKRFIEILNTFNALPAEQQTSEYLLRQIFNDETPEANPDG